MKSLFSFLVFFAILPQAMASQTDVDGFNKAVGNFASAIPVKLAEVPNVSWYFGVQCAEEKYSRGTTTYGLFDTAKGGLSSASDPATKKVSLHYKLFFLPNPPSGPFMPVETILDSQLTDLPSGDLGENSDDGFSTRNTLFRKYKSEGADYWISYNSSQLSAKYPYPPVIGTEWSVTYCWFTIP